jgi:hypothetical protein
MRSVRVVLVQFARGGEEGTGGCVDGGQYIVREFLPEAALGVPVADQVAEQVRCAIRCGVQRSRRRSRGSRS